MILTNQNYHQEEIQNTLCSANASCHRSHNMCRQSDIYRVNINRIPTFRDVRNFGCVNSDIRNSKSNQELNSNIFFSIKVLFIHQLIH